MPAIDMYLAHPLRCRKCKKQWPGWSYAVLVRAKRGNYQIVCGACLPDGWLSMSDKQREAALRSKEEGQ